MKPLLRALQDIIWSLKKSGEVWPPQMMLQPLGIHGEGGAGRNDGQREKWVFVRRSVHEAGIYVGSQTPFLVFLLFSSPFSLHFALNTLLHGAHPQSVSWEQREKEFQTCLHSLPYTSVRPEVHRCA